MDLYKMAGLEYGYESKSLGELMDSYPVVQKTMEHGKELQSYSPVAVFTYREGDFRYTLKTEGREYLRFHFHVESESVWEIRCGPPLERKPWDAFRERPMLLRNSPDELGATVYVHDMEVLPSTLGGQMIHVQVTGYPRQIQIMEAPEGGIFVLGDPIEKEDGSNIILEAGRVWPIGVSYHLVYDRDQRREVRDVLYRSPDIMDDLLFAKILHIETPNIPGDPRLVYVESQYGELGIFIDSLSELTDEQQALLRPGNYLYADMTLDGVVAFGDRENGLVMEHAEYLLAMMNIMRSRCAVNTYALLPLLAENVVYYSQYNDTEYHGVRDVLMKLKHTMEITTLANDRVEFALVIESGSDCPRPYPGGTPCLAIAYGKEDVSSLMFFDLDEDKRICAINVMNCEGYDILSHILDKQ